MSKSKGVGKLYDRLTPAERFRLNVEANARGDEKESQRLVESCPRRNYNMTDWAFSGRWQTTTEMVMAVCVELSQHMSRLHMIDAFREMLPFARNLYQNEAGVAYMNGHEAGRRYAWSRAGAYGDPPGWAPLDEDGDLQEDFDPAVEENLEKVEESIERADILPDVLARFEKETTRKAWTIWEAFAAFAREEFEVEPEKLVKVLFEPLLSGVEDLKRRREAFGVEVDKGRASEYAGALSDAWTRHLREAKRLSW